MQAPRRIAKLNKVRMLILMAVVVLGFIFLTGRLIYLQLIKGEQLEQKALSSQLTDTTLEANRGTIYDANMNKLVSSATVWTIYLDPSNMTSDKMKDEERDTIAQDLSKILGIDKADVIKASKQNNNYTKIATNVEYEAKQKVEAYRTQHNLLDCIGIDTSTKRYYSESKFASTVLGFCGSDNQGLEGLEAYYDSTLTGTPGRIVTAKTSKGNSMPNNYESVIEARDGYGLVLTLDEEIQYSLDKNVGEALENAAAKNAYGIVMEVKTGAILAMSNKPDFDSNSPWTLKNEKEKKALTKIKDPEKKAQTLSNCLAEQWRNKTITDTYEPGSVFKIVTAAAALEEGAVKESDTYTCTGSIQIQDRLYYCENHAGHGTQTFSEGLQHSCNPWFITAGQRLGLDKFYKYFEAFGLTERTGIDLPGEAAPTRGVTYHDKSAMGKVELASYSFGQSFQVTPIQMITAVSAVANSGKLMTPYCVKEVLDSKGNVVSATEPVVKRQVISKDTASQLCLMLEQVVTKGTGKNAYIAGYRVAGKTGTSEKLGTVKTGKKYVTSFVAFAPADDPKVAVLIAVDEPSKGYISGGTNAAPYVGNVISDCMDYYDIQPQYTDEEAANLQVIMPSVTGKSVSSAKNILSQKQLKYRIVGNGKKVLSQSPAAGRSVPKGGQVVLYTSDSGKSSVKVPDFTGMSISQANRTALAYGLNLEIKGNSLSGAAVSAYKQSAAAGSKVQMGTVVTVYFMSSPSANGVSKE